MRIRNDIVPGIPTYEADHDGSDAPWVWYGRSANRPLDASAEPWNSAPAMSQWLDATTGNIHYKTTSAAGGAWALVNRLSARTITVGTGCRYATLSEAMAAITDASDSNEYLIVVTGEITETTTITAKDHVNVLFLPGASVTVNMTGTGHAVSMSNLTNATWAAVDAGKPHIIRSGALSATGSHVLYTAGCSSGLRLINLYALNATTGYGTCYGIYNSSSNPTMTGCTGIGGSGGSSCYGIYNGSSSPTMTGCTGTGGSGGNTCYGIYNTGSGRCVAVASTFFGGGAYPVAASAAIPASSRQEDSFQPIATSAWRIVGAYISVTTAAEAGITMTLRDAAGGLGHALTDAIAVDSTGAKYFPITAHYVIPAGSYAYARLSSTSSTLAYTIYYIYEINNSTCYALYHDSTAASVFENCVFQSNASSSAVYVTSNGDDRSVFQGGVASSGMNSGTRPVAFACQVAWNPASVYNMVLDGGSSNLTCAAGTANGSCVEV